MARRLFYAGKITPRKPGSLLIYGGIDPFGEPQVHPLFQMILEGWTGGHECECEGANEENGWMEYICDRHANEDPRGD